MRITSYWNQLARSSGFIVCPINGNNRNCWILSVKQITSYCYKTRRGSIFQIPIYIFHNGPAIARRITRPPTIGVYKTYRIIKSVGIWRPSAAQFSHRIDHVETADHRIIQPCPVIITLLISSKPRF